MRENTSQYTSDQRIVVFALAIFVCSFLGPFGTANDLNLWDRVVFWTIAVVVVGVFMEFCITSALESRWLSSLPTLIQIAIGAAVGSAPGTSFVITINKVFRPDHLIGASFPMLWLQVTIMAILIAGLSALVNSRLRPTPLGAVEPVIDHEENTLDPLQTPRLMQRLPTRLREGQIISMSMQDHYVEVSTTHGNDMILMRLSDAIDLLDGISGVQTHRSHWAATAHSSALTRAARRHQLTLSDGRSIPVSNSFKKAVEQMLNEKGQT